MKDCATCGGVYDEYLGFTMHENRCAAITPAEKPVPGDEWRAALRTALDANVPVGTVNAATRDTIISNVIDALDRFMAAHLTADRATAENALEWGREGA